MNQSFSKIWIIVIALAVVAGGFFAWQYFSASKEGGDETADWKIITNTNGFIVRYPADITAFGVGMEVDETTAPRVIISKNPENQAYQGSFFQIDAISKEASIYKDMSLEASAKANYEANQANKNTFVELVDPISLTTLDNKPAYTYTIVSKGFSGKWSGWITDVPMKLKIIESENNGKHFILVYPLDDSLFSQIFSTFKFANDTVAWKTYKNDEYGFEIKYPIGTKVGDIDITSGREVWMQPPFSVGETNLTGKTLHIRMVTTQFNNGVEQADTCVSTAGTSYVAINGINFSKTDISAEFGGTQSAAVAIEYCTMRGNKAFKLVSELSYNRYSQLPKFDTEQGSEVFNQMLSTFKFLE